MERSGKKQKNGCDNDKSIYQEIMIKNRCVDGNKKGELWKSLGSGKKD